MRDGPLPRLDLPNVPQHIVQRGNDRQPCFAGPADYQNYRQELWEAAHKHGCALHAYVLMTNRAAGPHRRRKNVPDPFFGQQIETLVGRSMEVRSRGRPRSAPAEK